jgi:hypothetical protein
VNQKIPDHFSVIGETIHPISGKQGLLLRSRTTGVYSFLVGERYGGVPHKWASDYAASIGKPADELQDRLIVAMNAKGMTPLDVAKLVPSLSQKHVCDYLSRRSSMGSHKISLLLKALSLEIVSTIG